LWGNFYPMVVVGLHKALKHIFFESGVVWG